MHSVQRAVGGLLQHAAPLAACTLSGCQQAMLPLLKSCKHGESFIAFKSASRSTSTSTSSSSSSSGGGGELHVVVEPLSDVHEGVSVVSLTRPAARNALGRQLLRELGEAVTLLRQERSTRCIILRSTVPGVFSAGADLKERAGMTQQEAWECVSLLRRTFSDLAALPMPTIAAVDGLALGGGAELALACDLRVVSKNAVFAFPETHLGIIPGAGGTQRLARAVGESRAKQLVFTAARVSGVDAVAMGLAEELAEETGQAGVSSCSSQTGAGAGSAEGGVSAGAPAYARALVLAAEIRKAAPLALRQAKAAITLGQDMDLASGLRVEELAYAALLHTRDRLEGLAAFREKRMPLYTGE